MNERIRELAEQAETKEIGYYFFDKEKFAELIVRECAHVADISDASGIWIGGTILTHFGVEK